jgi:aryl-alcohol dehydrogenase-like predicted oxidoreductase
MVKTRDEGLIAGIGLSSIPSSTAGALDSTEIVCVQNAYNLVDRTSRLLDTCLDTASRSCVLTRLRPSPPTTPCSAPAVQREASKLGRTPAQIALAWTLSVAPNVLLSGHLVVQHLERTPRSPTSGWMTTPARLDDAVD